MAPAQSGCGCRPRQALRLGIEAGVVSEIRTELARQLASWKRIPHGVYRALLQVLPDHIAETFRHHHSRVGAQRKIESFCPQRFLRDVIAHAGQQSDMATPLRPRR
ncbi:MAG TPA: hypothetical protein PLE48_06465 [Thiobacillus sp.]|nr:hypothetical protein [Thiobacillus sp.]HQT70047.1 hypothetical protein [Thiobacillus sp.]